MTVSNETWRRLVQRQVERLSKDNRAVLFARYNTKQLNVLIVVLRQIRKGARVWFALDAGELRLCRRRWRRIVREGYDSAMDELN